MLYDLADGYEPLSTPILEMSLPKLLTSGSHPEYLFHTNTFPADRPTDNPFRTALLRLLNGIL